MSDHETTIDLSERKSDRMDVILWWVKGTLGTYVTVDDTERGGNYHVIPTPEGVSPNEVFYHPFRFQEMGGLAVEQHIVLGDS